MRKYLVRLIPLVSALPLSLYAAALNPDDVLQRVVAEIFTPVYQVVVGVSFLYFLYGVLKFIYDMNHPAEKNDGKNHLLWGTVGLFIIFSVGGILQVFGGFFQGTFIY